MGGGSVSSLTSFLPSTITGAMENVGMVVDALSGLISAATNIGDSFYSVYNSITGRNFKNDVNGVFTDIPKQAPGEAVMACQKLSEDIKKALAALSENKIEEPQEVPIACSGGEVVKCDQAFIDKSNADTKKLEDEINALMCQLQGKRFQLETANRTMDRCATQLNILNQQCMQEQQPEKPPEFRGPVMYNQETSITPYKPAVPTEPTCPYMAALPPPPVKECNCKVKGSCSKKKKAPKKRKTKKKPQKGVAIFKKRRVLPSRQPLCMI